MAWDFRVQVNIDFPALSAYVEYLIAAQQKQIDDIVAQFGEATDSLKKTTDKEQQAVDQTKEK